MSNNDLIVVTFKGELNIEHLKNLLETCGAESYVGGYGEGYIISLKMSKISEKDLLQKPFVKCIEPYPDIRISFSV